MKVARVCLVSRLSGLLESCLTPRHSSATRRRQQHCGCTRRLPDHAQIPQGANIAEQKTLVFNSLSARIGSMAIAAKQPLRMSSSQRSPTLSDAGMILPGCEPGHTHSSSSPVFERPPSVSALYDAYQSPQVGSPPQTLRRASQQKQSPPLSAQSSRSTLRNMGDSGGAAKRSPPRDSGRASSGTSPTGDAHGPNTKSHLQGSWEEREQRRISTASSMLSEDFENWPGFDSHEPFDDSGVDLEEQERRDKMPREDMENEPWMQGRTGGSDEDDMDDPHSSAALSRRAELILANAKKRLNVGAAKKGLLVARPLTVTGYGGEPQGSPRIPRGVANLPPIQERL
jgi:hypothetical protein